MGIIETLYMQTPSSSTSSSRPQLKNIKSAEPTTGSKRSPYVTDPVANPHPLPVEPNDKRGVIVVYPLYRETEQGPIGTQVPAVPGNVVAGRDASSTRNGDIRVAPNRGTAAYSGPTGAVTIHGTSTLPKPTLSSIGRSVGGGMLRSLLQPSSPAIQQTTHNAAGLVAEEKRAVISGSQQSQQSQ